MRLHFTRVLHGQDKTEVKEGTLLFQVMLIYWRVENDLPQSRAHILFQEMSLTVDEKRNQRVLE